MARLVQKLLRLHLYAHIMRILVARYFRIAKDVQAHHQLGPKSCNLFLNQYFVNIRRMNPNFFVKEVKNYLFTQWIFWGFQLINYGGRHCSKNSCLFGIQLALFVGLKVDDLWFLNWAFIYHAGSKLVRRTMGAPARERWRRFWLRKEVAKPDSGRCSALPVWPGICFFKTQVNIFSTSLFLLCTKKVFVVNFRGMYTFWRQFIL